MDYRKTAQEILGYVGGSKNIVSAAHCATRLRLVIADNSKADKEAIENVDGVKGVFEASGQLQIILGTGTVNKVFDEFIAIAGITASTKAEAKEAAAEKQNWFMKAIKLLGDIFVPIIPAIVASGFLMGIMNALDFMNANGFLTINTNSSIYVFANLFSNIAYTFLQILIAFSAAKAFGANQYLGAVIGMIMIHPSLQNAYTVATEGVQQTQSVFFGLYHIDMVGYQGHVIPVIIAVWILSVLEKKLHKVVPAALDLFVTPLVSVFVTGYLTLSIVGPIFVWGENAILGAIQWMLTLPLGLGSLIMGGLYAPTVVTGIHQMYTAIDIGQLAKYGVTYWLPLASAANVAQGAAALAVGIKSKDKKIKSLALPSSLSAFMGITEPAIFGVNLRFFKPFIAGCIGGGCGALYASLVHLGAKGTGVTGIFGILLCLNQPLQYLIEMVIAVGVAFVISFLIYKDAEPKAATETAAVENIETADAVIKEAGADLKYEVGTMIEIPRAALTADEIAKEAEFFCFGTNDLTQMTFGFSRDDAGKFLDAYYDAKIFENDPFAKLDQTGVGKLMDMAVKLGKEVRPEMHIGICGEHGGDPSSVEFCHKLGLTYVSCSPFRVPIARLAAAQAAIASK